MRRILVGALMTAVGLAPAAALATTVYPIDRAQILAGSRFDFKVELDGVLAPADVQVTINGEDPARVLGAESGVRRAGDGGRGLGPPPPGREPGHPGPLRRVGERRPDDPNGHLGRLRHRRAPRPGT